jgi:hypothetical protein
MYNVIAIHIERDFLTIIHFCQQYITKLVKRIYINIKALKMRSTESREVFSQFVYEFFQKTSQNQ